MKYFKRPRNYSGESLVDGLKTSVYGRTSKWKSNEELFAKIGTLEEIAFWNDIDYSDSIVAHREMLVLLRDGVLKEVSDDYD